MPDYFYSVEDIENIKLLASYYELDAEALFALPVSYLQKVCNGAGPERWSDVKRKALTDSLKRYEPAFAQHDVDYAIQIPKQIADKRLLDNMIRIWAKYFGVFRWFKSSALIERKIIIPLVYTSVVTAGESAYNESKRSLFNINPK